MMLMMMNTIIITHIHKFCEAGVPILQYSIKLWLFDDGIIFS